MTGLLFDIAPLEPTKPTWERFGEPGLYAVHHHNPSGMRVQHCGHPTANFPYFIHCPDETQILAPNGRGFQKLSLAKAHVEGIHAGVIERKPVTEALPVKAKKQSKPVALFDLGTKEELRAEKRAAAVAEQRKHQREREALDVVGNRLLELGFIQWTENGRKWWAEVNRRAA